MNLDPARFIAALSSRWRSRFSPSKSPSPRSYLHQRNDLAPMALFIWQPGATPQGHSRFLTLSAEGAIQAVYEPHLQRWRLHSIVYPGVAPGYDEYRAFGAN